MLAFFCVYLVPGKLALISMVRFLHFLGGCQGRGALVKSLTPP